jgi:hypothetical protein
VPITHTWSDIDAKLVLRHPTSEKPVNLRLAPMVMEELNRLTKLPTSGPMIVSEAMKQPREPRVPTPVAYPGQCDGSAELRLQHGQAGAQDGRPSRRRPTPAATLPLAIPRRMIQVIN